MITRSDFRYVDGSSFWRLTREETEAALRTLWPAGRRYAPRATGRADYRYPK